MPPPDDLKRTSYLPGSTMVELSGFALYLTRYVMPTTVPLSTMCTSSSAAGAAASGSITIVGRELDSPFNPADAGGPGAGGILVARRARFLRASSCCGSRFFLGLSGLGVLHAKV